MENMNFNIRSNNTNFSNLENLELKKTDEGTLENEPVSIFNGNTETIETIDNLSLNKPMENTEQEIPEEGDEDLNVGENDGINTYEKACAFIEAGCSCVGSSSAVKIVEEERKLFPNG